MPRFLSPFIGIILLVLYLSAELPAAPAEAESYPHQVIIVSIPGFSFLELEADKLERLPNLKRLVSQSGLGAMNIRTHRRSMSDVYVTLGAGASARGAAGVQAFHGNEIWQGLTANEWMMRYTGQDLAGREDIIIPKRDILKRVNHEQLANTGPGAMGELLKRNRIDRIVLGNSDLGIMGSEDKELRRYAAQMLMDEEGGVDGGIIGKNGLITASDRPYGVKTNYEYVLNPFKQTLSKNRVVLLELGDLYRLYAEKNSYSSDRYNQMKNVILQEIDACVGSLVNNLSKTDTLWIFTPEVSSEAMEARSLLSPLFLYREGIQPGLLISETTRRAGVVVQTDLSASLLHEFGIKGTAGMTGQPMSITPKNDALSWLLEDEAAMRKVYQLRPSLLLSFAAYEVAVLLLSLIYAVVISWRSYKLTQLDKSWGMQVCRICLISVLAAPFVMFVMGFWLKWVLIAAGEKAALGWLFISFLITVPIGSYLLSRIKLLTSLAVLGWGTSLCILLDGCTGEHALRYSALSYDPMIGARFYGIGNELMGVLIGALVLAVTVSLQRRHDRALADAPAAASAASPRRAAWLACAVFVLVTLYLAAPSFGTNAGGTLSAAVAFGIAGARCCAGSPGRELHWSRVATLLTALLAAALLALWLLSSADSPAAAGRESHIGRAFHALREGQFDQLRELIVRKLRMNRHLIGVSAWSKVLITSLFVMAVLVLRPRGRLGLWQHQYPYLMYGFSANTLGAVAALLLNDSGIVAAATMIVYVTVPILLLRLQERRASHSS